MPFRSLVGFMFAVVGGSLVLQACVGQMGSLDSAVVDAATHDGSVGRDVTTTDQAVPSDAPAHDSVAPDVHNVVPDGFSGTNASMHLVSRNIAAYASSGPNVYTGPDLAHDTQPNVGWAPPSLPAWIAYDLSSRTAAERQQDLVVATAINNVYISTPPQAFQKMPLDYTIEINAAPGGGDPPSTGWTQLVNVTDNTRGTVQHLLSLNGANWVRMTVTRTSDPDGALVLDLDVYSAPSGATDSWLFMGDSITFMTMSYAFSDMPSLVAAESSGRWPAVIDAAIGGTGAITAVNVIADTMSQFPGRYVVLAYGTNDHPDGFHDNMATLIQAIIAAGKVPVVPHVIWSDTKLVEGPTQNAAIDQLYQEYPLLLRGPDLWADFQGRTDLIAHGDVHPGATGQEYLRQVWADFINAVP